MAKMPDGHSILLFDGVCNLCNATVQFVVRRDRAGVFRFAPLQSPAARALLTDRTLPEADPESVVLLEGGKVYARSTAALRVARRLRFPWPCLYGFILIPRPLRDGVYTFIARRRYRWFGRTELCQTPTPDLAERFMTEEELSQQGNRDRKIG